MAIYAISDLHLAYGTPEKTMTVFGARWQDYEEKLKKNWLSKVKPEDIVILSGDFSWATYLEGSKNDFEFLNSLPGIKYMLKGNHDYWWSTLKSMNEFLANNKYDNIHFLYNNSYDIGKYVLAGTRYWGYDENADDNEKIFNREVLRAKLSLDSAVKLAHNKPIIFTTHYPPDSRIIDALKDYNIKVWIYGHIHTNYEENLVQIPNIEAHLTSCDYLNFDMIEIN